MPSSEPAAAPKKLGLFASLAVTLGTWRLAAVSLLSVSSGLPLGLILTGIPAWMTDEQVDIKTIGVITMAQAPYGLKFLWSPLMDRLMPPALGRRRGWVLICQLVLAAATFALMSQADKPLIGAVAALSLLIAFASASQDISYDAYVVELLEPHEHAVVVGARSAMYRAGMWISGYIVVTAHGLIGWRLTLGLLGAIYLALLPVTVFAPEPTGLPQPPRSLRAAVWEPFVAFLGRQHALTLVGFILVYRLAATMADALVTPFLLQQGYSSFEVGIGRGTVGLIGTLAGTFAGGAMTAKLGVGRSLWLAGIITAIANLGYVAVAVAPRPSSDAEVTVQSGGLYLQQQEGGLLHVGSDVEVLDKDSKSIGRGKVGAFGQYGARIEIEGQALKGLPAHGRYQTNWWVWMLMYAAIALETATIGLGWGAFGVMLLRLTDKRFSATQYALFSSMVGITRTMAGPAAGVLVDAFGWRDFFFLTIPMAIPGLLLLARFAPWGTEPKEMTGDALEVLPPGPPWPRALLWLSGIGITLAGGAAALSMSALLTAVKHYRDHKPFDFVDSLLLAALPKSASTAIDLISAVAFGLVVGLGTAAFLAARGRRGAKPVTSTP
ncbi:MAG: MFS transporter [Myxococcaceae bacterium]